jgi:hypothetical protein
MSLYQACKNTVLKIIEIIYHAQCTQKNTEYIFLLLNSTNIVYIAIL